MNRDNSRGMSQECADAAVDRMVQAFAPHAANQAFHIRILPRAPWRRNDLFHAHRRHGRAERLPVCAVPVADQVPRRRAPRECLSDLLCDPRHRRVRRDTEMHDLAALVVEHDEPDGRRWNVAVGTTKKSIDARQSVRTPEQ